MRSGKPYHQTPPLLQNLGGDVDKVAAKSFPLPTYHLAGQGDLCDPLAEIPGQSGDLKPGRVAHKLRHRHAPPGNPVTKLLDDVLLVAALIGKIDNLSGTVRARQVGEHQPITEMLKERPLPISLFDQNPPHDHPARKAKPRGLIGYLTHPLLHRTQRAKPSILGFHSTVVRP